MWVLRPDVHHGPWKVPCGKLGMISSKTVSGERGPGGTLAERRLYVNMDCPLAERLHAESQYGSWHSGAVTFAVQHAQVGAPRTHGRPILVRHDSGDLVQVREVVSCPCR